MGLDLALGVVVLIAAIRGWMRGFVSQAVRMAGFVACFYLADPVRDQARPHVLARLPKVDPALMERILWWCSAAASYVVVVGVVMLLIKLARRPDAAGKVEVRRDNQFAGFLLGAAKGTLAAVFLLSGVQKYADALAGKFDWANGVMERSRALDWNRRYEPAPKIWESPPVRRFVDHIRRNGLAAPADDATDPVATPIEQAEGQVAAVRIPDVVRPTPRLAMPDFDPETLADLERFKAERDARRSRRAEPDWR